MPSFPSNLLVFHEKASLRPQNDVVCLLRSPKFLESEIQFSVSKREEKSSKEKAKYFDDQNTIEDASSRYLAIRKILKALK